MTGTKHDTNKPRMDILLSMRHLGEILELAHADTTRYRVSPETAVDIAITKLHLFATGEDRHRAETPLHVTQAAALLMASMEPERTLHDSTSPWRLRALEAVAHVVTHGAAKYDVRTELWANNWRFGMRWSRLIAAAFRHLYAHLRGETVDSETGLPHVAHAITNLLFLREFYDLHPEHDDRPHPWRAPRRIALDIDGVICDTYPYVLDMLAGAGLPMRDDMPHYAVPERFHGVLEAMTYSEWVELPAFLPGDSLAYEPVAYITSRNERAGRAASEWLDRHHFPPAPVIVCLTHEKVSALQEIEADVFVEDKFETFAAVQNAGIACYLIDRPYNTKHRVGDYRITTVNDVPFF